MLVLPVKCIYNNCRETIFIFKKIFCANRLISKIQFNYVTVFLGCLVYNKFDFLRHTGKVNT